MEQVILIKDISQTKMEALLNFLRSCDIEAEVKSELEVSVTKRPSDFFGTMSREEGEKMQAHVSHSRNEWNRNT